MQRAVGQDAVPALPDGRRAHPDRVQPGREIFVEEKLFGKIVHPVFGEREKKIGRSRKTRDEVVVVFGEVGPERFDDARSLSFRNETEI